MLAQTDRVERPPLPPIMVAPDLPHAGSDQLLVDEYRDQAIQRHDEYRSKRGLGILGLAVHVQLAGQGSQAVQSPSS